MDTAFVDTSAWIAYVSSTDAHHRRATELIDGADSPLVTTWPMVWETISLLSRRGQVRWAVEIGKELIAETMARLVELQSVDHALAFDVMVVGRLKERLENTAVEFDT